MFLQKIRTRLEAVETLGAKLELQRTLDRGGADVLLERIAALEKAYESQDSRLRLLKVEWESVLDKVNSVMGRLNARIRKFESQDPPEDPKPQEESGGYPGGSHALLSTMRGKRGVLSR